MLFPLPLLNGHCGFDTVVGCSADSMDCWLHCLLNRPCSSSNLTFESRDNQLEGLPNAHITYALSPLTDFSLSWEQLSAQPALSDVCASMHAGFTSFNAPYGTPKPPCLSARKRILRAATMQWPHMSHASSTARHREVAHWSLPVHGQVEDCSLVMVPLVAANAAPLLIVNSFYFVLSM